MKVPLLVTGGGRPKHPRCGYFVEPTVFAKCGQRSDHCARGDLQVLSSALISFGR